MKRKIREIALLLVPVAALAAVVPGARLINDWREARELRVPTRPRIEACYLRAPTAWEAFNGAKVAFTARTAAPATAALSGVHWRSTMEFRNDAGRVWNTDRNSVEQYLIESGQYVVGNESITTSESTGGLRWQKLLGGSDQLYVRVLLQKQNSTLKVLDGITRDFVFKNPPTPRLLASLRSSNFALQKVELRTKTEGNVLEQRFIFWVKRSGEPFVTYPDSNSSGDWKLSLNAYDYNNPFVDTVGFMGTATLPKADGTASIEQFFSDDMPYFRGKPAHLTGLISFNDGWPQQIRVELPHGLPAKIGTVNLPFTATLAPLPK